MNKSYFSNNPELNQSEFALLQEWIANTVSELNPKCVESDANVSKNQKIRVIDDSVYCVKKVKYQPSEDGNIGKNHDIRPKDVELKTDNERFPQNCTEGLENTWGFEKKNREIKIPVRKYEEIIEKQVGYEKPSEKSEISTNRSLISEANASRDKENHGKLVIPMRNYDKQSEIQKLPLAISKPGLSFNDKIIRSEVKPMNSTTDRLTWEADWGTPVNPNVKSLVSTNKKLIQAKKTQISQEFQFKKAEVQENPREDSKEYAGRPSEFKKDIMFWVGTVVTSKNKFTNQELIEKYGISAEITEENPFCITLFKSAWLQTEYFDLKSIEAVFNAKISQFLQQSEKKALLIKFNL